MKIYFDVKNQIITRTDRNQVIANSADYLEAEITFSAEWASMEKTMTFKNGNLLYTYALVNDKILEENHLNLGVGTWKVSIQGVYEDKKIVTNECNLAVNASGWIGSEALPPESIWNQLLVIIQSLHTEAASTAVLRSAVQKYIEDNYDALVKEAVIVDDVRAALDDMAEDGTLSDLLAPLVAAGMPEVVADQISAVVAAQIGGTVSTQLPSVVNTQLPSLVTPAVNTYCATNFSAWSGALDSTLTQPLMAAPADKVGQIKSALSELLDDKMYYPINRFDKTAKTDGYDFNSQGNLIESEGYFVSDYIDVTNFASFVVTYWSAGNYVVRQCHYVEYDGTKTKIGSRKTTASSGTTAITEGTKFIRFIESISRVNNLVFSETIPSAYSAYFAPYYDSERLKDIEDKEDELEDRIDALEPHVVTVGASGADYTSLLEALKETESSVEVHVMKGTYNIKDEYISYYANANFWDEYEGYSDSDDPFMRGLWLGDNRKVICEAGVHFVFDYSGSNATVSSQFSVFANGSNTTLDGCEIWVNNNVRYSIHDDFKPSFGEVVWRNIIFHGVPHSSAHIGSGLGYNSRYLLENLVFIENNSLYDISYHGVNTSNPGSFPCNVIVRGCYGTKKCAFRYLGKVSDVSKAIVHGCTFSEIECVPYDETVQTIDIQMFKYNNIETV